MNYWVYYNDGYAEDGDTGIHHSSTEEDALEFITDRIRKDPRGDRTIDDYTLIRGERLNLKPIIFASKIIVDTTKGH